jgi:Flp pilus assembly pilin Flp
MTKLEYLVKNDEGQDVVEYALLAAFISIVAIATLQLIGPLVDGIYQNIHDALNSAP